MVGISEVSVRYQYQVLVRSAAPPVGCGEGLMGDGGWRMFLL
jgi:hypothetical protein